MSELTNYIKERIQTYEKQREDNQHPNNIIMTNNYCIACATLVELQAVLSKIEELNK